MCRQRYNVVTLTSEPYVISNQESVGLLLNKGFKRTV